MNLKETSDKKLVDDSIDIELNKDYPQYRIELLSRLARGRKAIEAMDEIRRIFDTCPSYDVDTFQDIDIILMRFENEYSGATDEN